MAINKHQLYKAVASHTQTYNGNNPDTGSAWTNAERVNDILKIKNEVDAHLLTLEPVIDNSADEAAAIAKHDGVEAYLLDLKNTQPEQFETERKLPFEQQAINAGL